MTQNKAKNKLGEEDKAYHETHNDITHYLSFYDKSYKTSLSQLDINWIFPNSAVFSAVNVSTPIVHSYR